MLSSRLNEAEFLPNYGVPDGFNEATYLEKLSYDGLRQRIKEANYPVDEPLYKQLTGIRARRHQSNGVSRLLSDCLGLHQLLQEARVGWTGTREWRRLTCCIRASNHRISTRFPTT